MRLLRIGCGAALIVALAGPALAGRSAPTPARLASGEGDVLVLTDGAAGWVEATAPLVTKPVQLNYTNASAIADIIKTRLSRDCPQSQQTTTSAPVLVARSASGHLSQTRRRRLDGSPPGSGWA